MNDGNVADYIPERAQANPEWFGICTATRNGHLYEVDDTRQEFSSRFHSVNARSNPCGRRRQANLEISAPRS